MPCDHELYMYVRRTYPFMSADAFIFENGYGGRIHYSRPPYPFWKIHVRLIIQKWKMDRLCIHFLARTRT